GQWLCWPLRGGRSMARLDKLTVKAREGLAAAQELAGGLQQQEVQPEHLLLALLRQEGGVVSALVRKVGVDDGMLDRAFDAALGEFPKVSGAVDLYLGSRTKTLLDEAGKEAAALKDDYLSSEHFLLGAAHKDVGPVSRILREAGLDHETLLRALGEV